VSFINEVISSVYFNQVTFIAPPHLALLLWTTRFITVTKNPFCLGQLRPHSQTNYNICYVKLECRTHTAEISSKRYPLTQFLGHSAACILKPHSVIVWVCEEERKIKKLEQSKYMTTLTYSGTIKKDVKTTRAPKTWNLTRASLII
jgi:hypothetical protein